MQQPVLLCPVAVEDTAQLCKAACVNPKRSNDALVALLDYWIRKPLLHNQEGLDNPDDLAVFAVVTVVVTLALPPGPNTSHLN